MMGVLKGLRLTAFYDGDNYMQGDARRRFIYAATFEHKYVNAGYEHFDTADQTKVSVAEVKAHGYSIWATPRTTKGWEGLLRYDYYSDPNTLSTTAAKVRKIAGVAYWFHTLQAPATAALLADYETVVFDTALAKPDEKRYALHALFNF